MVKCMKNKGAAQIIGILLLLGLFIFLFKPFLGEIFIQAPTITVGDDGEILVSDSRVGRSGGYDNYVASIWVDNELLCCNSIPSDGLICQKINPSQGNHIILGEHGCRPEF